MAEVAAGAGIALAAEQAVSTTAYAGAVGYAIGKSTMPLKATYTMIAHAADDSSRHSLARRNHTLTVIGNKAYIFGGDVQSKDSLNNDWQITSNDMHVVTLSSSGEPESDYHMIPALPSQEGGKVPKARTLHSACAFDGCVAIYGGMDESKQIIEEDASIWLFDPEKKSWSELPANNSESDSKPGSRFRANLFAHSNRLILYGGMDTMMTQSSEVWQFDIDTGVWQKISEAPASESSAAFTNGVLYLISSSDPMSSQLHHLNLICKDVSWKSITFPTNPMAPGPRPREHGGLLPITTGYGRNFLVYFLGAREKPSSHDKSEGVTQWSDMWTLQIPSSNLSVERKTTLSEAIKPAKIKDAIRSMLPGTESGVYTWAEVEVQIPKPDELNAEGKLHPGPRSFFGCDVMDGGRSVAIWGGEDAKGERVGDGWIVRLE
ncbi:galactose oxidase [Melanomma pulvis-pyrius CBS 109.77]|uniref:Galactose oxidase n=1 Tax=Melanomma pulvis-pyrius CBS 109.77 TaxID=1314802 RepID=A0A6A6XPF4_9PLEO|nr:galactose oxidase [Melanomma pulvis-pyrius CBS 109.77]